MLWLLSAVAVVGAVSGFDWTFAFDWKRDDVTRERARENIGFVGEGGREMDDEM